MLNLGPLGSICSFTYKMQVETSYACFFFGKQCRTSNVCFLQLSSIKQHSYYHKSTFPKFTLSFEGGSLSSFLGWPTTSRANNHVFGNFLPRAENLQQVFLTMFYNLEKRRAVFWHLPWKPSKLIYSKLIWTLRPSGCILDSIVWFYFVLFIISIICDAVFLCCSFGIKLLSPQG